MDQNRPILLFDSGVGGLTVLAALRDLMPDAPVIYAADQAGLPYGTKSEAQIAARVAGLLGRMCERYDPRLACIACNTASTIALGMVRDVLEIPIVGTVPAIKPAAAITKTGVIGLLGTEATIRQGYVDNLEKEFASGKHLLRHAAPGLVEAAEAKLRGQPIDQAAIQHAADALLAMETGDRIDTVVLACTNVKFIDGAAGIARRIQYLMQDKDFSGEDMNRAITTGDLDDLKTLAPRFAELGIERLEEF